MNVITSVVVFPDAVGMRMSATWSEVDESTGRVISDNHRFDRVLINQEDKTKAQAVIDVATGFLNTAE